MEENTIKRLKEYGEKYPKLLPCDLFKYIYQSSFGCEHLVSPSANVTDWIIKEYENCVKQKSENDLVECLDGEYSRVDIDSLRHGLSPETLGKMFFLSAKKEQNGAEELQKKLDAAKELASENVFSFSREEFDYAWAEWEAAGYPPIHHSSAFRTEYRPAYRVVANRYAEFLPLFIKIDRLIKNGQTTVAIDGGSASGKSTLGKILSEVYDCTVFHMDDFFLPLEKRTPERFSEIGGNVDYERFSEEVLIPLSKGECVKYKKFDCSTMSFADEIQVTPKDLVIVEGAYSMHPELAGYYDLSVYLNISPELQRKRISHRNSPKMAERFFGEWIPLENRYFEETKIEERCGMTFKINE